MKDYLTIKQKLLILAFSVFITFSVSGGILFLIEKKTESVTEYSSVNKGAKNQNFTIKHLK